jgi:imidazolonepropionase-like amidohydrolase
LSIWIVTPSEQGPSAFESLAARDDSARLLREAGVPLIISSASWSNNVRRLRQEAGIAVANGLPYGEALIAVTSAPARVFGRDDTGVIAVGKRADLVLWTGDPFELSSTAERVWIGGELMPDANRQRELARRYHSQVTR